MRDLISLAAAGSSPGELGRIYEWYTARTVRAIGTAYAVAVAAAGALVHHVLTADPDNLLLIILLGLGALLAAVVGLFQHAELAQLPRELTVATRLVVTFSALRDAGIDLGTPSPARLDATWPRPRVWVGGGMLCALAAIAVVKEHGDSEVVAAVISGIGLIALWARVSAELEPSPEPPSPKLGWHLTLVERIGPYRLDDYVSQPDIAAYVDTCIAQAQVGGKRPASARRRRYGRRAR